MLLEVGEFCKRVATDLPGLVAALQEQTGRYGQAEQMAWEVSLDHAARVLHHPDLERLHLHVGDRGGVSLEYRLPASSAWADLVLLGRGESCPSAVVVEFKDWDTYGDRPGPSEGVVWHHGNLELHPSDQVRGYTEYCRRFHSAVQDAAAEVAGCAYFTRPGASAVYCQPPHDALTASYPVFADSPLDVDERFPAFLKERIPYPDSAFARRFEEGSYRQDRNFCRQMAAQIAEPGKTPFVLLDGQRKGFEVCRAAVRGVLEAATGEEKKIVLIIEGPPGSGKSVVAARLWADLMLDERLNDGSLVVTTTSASQRSNWESLFSQTAGSRAGAGVVVPANRYAPESVAWVGGYRKRHGKDALPVSEWRENVEVCRRQGRLRCLDDLFLVSIVDEAHALINPENQRSRAGQTGWPIAFGPQAFHIIRASKVTVFLMDSGQGFRDRESTTRSDIERWAGDLGASVVTPLSLAGSQFRAAGSAEYVDWLERCLGLQGESTPAVRPGVKGSDRPGFALEIVDSPADLDEKLRRHHAAGTSVRLLASFGRKWVTRDISSPHSLPPKSRDFHIAFARNGRNETWSRIWNYAPDGNYTLFVQAPPGSMMNDDPLCEVGCPYVVRGFDWDWTGVLWLRDLVRRDGRWTVDLDHVHETGFPHALAAAKRERKAGKPGPAYEDLLRRIQQAYRILLSRAIKGTYVWFEDDETRDYVASRL